MSSELADLAERFARFAETECRGHSRLYERLAGGVAADPDLLRLAARARPGQPVPNLFFAAVHDLLLTGVAHPLAGHYQSLGGPAADDGDALAALRDFCLGHGEAIATRLESGRVQTNEVRRSACLLPAFGLVHRLGGGRPLALVEIGTAAGLNLRWDRYRYDYGPAGSTGDPAAAVVVSCEPRGQARPPLPEPLPAVAWRVGLDLNPIDVRDEVAARWLRALVWPDQPCRAELLERAIADLRSDPPRLVGGDAVELLPSILDQVPPGTTLCLFHTFVINQMPPEARERLAAILSERVPFVVTMGGVAVPVGRGSHLSLNDRPLAVCDAHGEWIEWLAHEEEEVQ